MKKFVSLLVSFALTLSLTTPTFATSYKNDAVGTASAAETWVDESVQDVAVYYDELMAHFSSTYSGSGEKTYPDYYGGSYIK